MNYDELLTNHLGEFGLYQKGIYFLVCLPAIWCSINMFVWTFAGADIPHRCKLSDSDSDFWNPPSTTAFHNWTTGPDGGAFDQCRRLETQFHIYQTCQDGYVYDNTEITAGAAQDWNLVCDRKIVKALIQALFYCGIFCGSLTLGHLGDKFGRKMVIIVGSFSITTISILCIYSPNEYVFAMFRFAQGFIEPSVWQIPFVLAIELVGPNKRMLAGMIIEFFFSFGLILLGCIAYFVRDWQNLQVIVSAPGFIFVTYYWLIPESPRWLLSVGRREEAFAVLRKAAYWNGVALSDEILQQVQATSDEEKKSVDENSSLSSDETPQKPNEHRRDYSWIDLFRTPTMRKRTLICCYCWMIVVLLYYGISLNPAAIAAGDFYVSFILSGFVELPALTFLILSLDCLGRKALQFSGFLVTGACMLALIVTPSDYSGWLMAQMLMSKSAAVTAFSVIYLHTSEMFPTVVRSSAFGLLVTCSRIGGIISPIASVYLEDECKSVVLGVFCGLAVMAAFLTLLLPETAYQKLPEDLEEGEQFGRNISLCHPGFCPTKPSHRGSLTEVIAVVPVIGSCGVVGGDEGSTDETNESDDGDVQDQLIVSDEKTSISADNAIDTLQQDVVYKGEAI